jgi:hypothetical protein
VGDDVGPRSSASASASTSTSTFSIELDDEPHPLFTCFLNHPILADIIQYPLGYNSINDKKISGYTIDSQSNNTSHSQSANKHISFSINKHIPLSIS